MQNLIHQAHTFMFQRTSNLGIQHPFTPLIITYCFHFMSFMFHSFLNHINLLPSEELCFKKFSNNNSSLHRFSIACTKPAISFAIYIKHNAPGRIGVYFLKRTQLSWSKQLRCLKAFPVWPQDFDDIEYGGDDTERKHCT